jgi:hypothetical protein
MFSQLDVGIDCSFSSKKKGSTGFYCLSIAYTYIQRYRIMFPVESSGIGSKF